jgi:hypothetical protein
LLIAVAVGLLRQGAYFASAQWSVGLLVAGALFLALAVQPLSVADLRLPPMPFLLALAAWALVAATIDGTWTSGLRPALLLTPRSSSYADGSRGGTKRSSLSESSRRV